MIFKKIEKLLNLNGKRGKSKLDLLKTFPLYKPYSSGKYLDRANLTVLAINELIPLLVKLGYYTSKNRVKHIGVDDVSTKKSLDYSNNLKDIFNRNNSDKAAEANLYHLLYAFLLPNQ
jgi:hypothetical protein